jgi:hypothetical protein
MAAEELIRLLTNKGRSKHLIFARLRAPGQEGAAGYFGGRIRIYQLTRDRPIIRRFPTGFALYSLEWRKTYSWRKGHGRCFA